MGRVVSFDGMEIDDYNSISSKKDRASDRSFFTHIDLGRRV